MNEASDTGLISLSEERLAILEKSRELNPAEKVNILLLLLHRKWITDFSYDNPKEYDRLGSELKRLGLPFFVDSYIHVNGRKIDWLQIAGSKEILCFLQKRREVLSTVEAGILYGYPTSATLAFEGVLSSRKCDPAHLNVVSFYLGGVYSDELYSREREIMTRTWELLESVSPTIAQEAVEHMHSIRPDFTGAKE